MTSVSKLPPAVDRPVAAVSLLIFSTFLLSIQDAGMKIFSAEMSLWQFALLRAVFGLPILVLATRLIGARARLIPIRWHAVAIRTGFILLALICFFSALSKLGLAQAAAGLYTAPLFVGIFSHLLLREKVGPRRVAAIIAGFAGVMLILRPDAGATGLISLLPVGAGALYALALISTRWLCAGESPFALAAATQVAFGLAGLIGSAWLVLAPPSAEIAAAVPALFRPWIDPGATGLWAIVAIAVLNVVAHTGSARAYQTAEASFLAPFDYGYLVFATLWGVLYWGEAVSAPMVLGMAMIAGGGAYVAWRERRIAAP